MLCKLLQLRPNRAQKLPYMDAARSLRFVRLLCLIDLLDNDIRRRREVAYYVESRLLQSTLLPERSDTLLQGDFPSSSHTSDSSSDHVSVHTFSDQDSDM